MIQSYEDLEVYQKAYKLALEMHQITLKFPEHERYELGSQLRRASKSISLTIGEGYGKRASASEFKRFLSMAIGSCDEVKIILSFAKDLGYITEEQHEIYRQDYDIVGKMLFRLQKNWR